MKDLYEKFAYDYDEFGEIENHSGDERSFLKELFAEHDVKKVLDCACGTGQHLHMFTELGYDAAGSDYSDAMLDVAKILLISFIMGNELKPVSMKWFTGFCSMRIINVCWQKRGLKKQRCMAVMTGRHMEKKVGKS